MGETFNKWLDAHNKGEDDPVWIKSKLADLEDKSKENKIKI